MKKHNYNTSVNLYPGHADATAVIFKKRPQLAQFLQPQQTLEDYLEPVLTHKMDRSVFSAADQLAEIIVKEIEYLYGRQMADAAAESLVQNWSVESGAHAAIPRRHDKITKTERPQLNSIIIQGQLLWATLRASRGHSVHIALATGIVPPNNDNSGRYLDYSQSAKPIALLSNAHKQTPQSLIPPLSTGTLAGVSQKIHSSLASREEKAYAQGLVSAMSDGASQTFADQLLHAHKYYTAQALPDGQHYLSVDSIKIARLFMIQQLRKDGLTRAIFTNPRLNFKFKEALAGIQTGWEVYESMFYHADDVSGVPYLYEADEEFISADDLIQKLESQEFVPKTLLRFAIILLETGLCLSGGMSQSNYCTELRARLSQFVHDAFPAYRDRAAAIAAIPLDRAIFTPCWGVKDNAGEVTALDALDLVHNPADAQTMQQIAQIHTTHAFSAALPTLSILLGDTPVGYPAIDHLKAAGLIVKS